ncbi:hypothetical protein GTY23_23270 [Streptomyces sp. SID5998]|nr:hypothetical protein [Streptomyces sp. SID5998]
MSREQPVEPDHTPQPSRVLAEPATVKACARDLRPTDPASPRGVQAAAAAARTQSALARMAARR